MYTGLNPPRETRIELIIASATDGRHVYGGGSVPSAWIVGRGDVGSSPNERNVRSTFGVVADGDVILDQTQACPVTLRGAFTSITGLMSITPQYRLPIQVGNGPSCGSAARIHGERSSGENEFEAPTRALFCPVKPFVPVIPLVGDAREPRANGCDQKMQPQPRALAEMAELVRQGKGVVEVVLPVHQHVGRRGIGTIRKRAAGFALVFHYVDPARFEAPAHRIDILRAQRPRGFQHMFFRLVIGNFALRSRDHRHI